MKSEILEAALRIYPLKGWDSKIEINKISRQKLKRTVQKLLEEHGKFPVPWDTSRDYPGLFVVVTGNRFLGYSGMSEPEAEAYADESPPLGLTVEDLANAENAAEVILDCHFAA